MPPRKSSSEEPEPVQMTDVASSALRRVGYEPKGKRLAVEFRDGMIYEYRPVPKNIYDDLMASESKGQFFEDHIKLRYIYRQVRERD
jgi:hypothetical protein